VLKGVLTVGWAWDIDAAEMLDVAVFLTEQDAGGLGSTLPLRHRKP
jgi:hypothetical protein